MIATALLEESLVLRRAGIAAPLLVFGPLTRDQAPLALDHDITLGIPGPEELALVCESARERDIKVHLKLDSGMGRMGVTEAELGGAIEMIRATPRLRLAGVYTHLANADVEGEHFTETQIAAPSNSPVAKGRRGSWFRFCTSHSSRNAFSASSRPSVPIPTTRVYGISGGRWLIQPDIRSRMEPPAGRISR